jgi:iron complex outermembrane receptor protein
MAAWDIKPSDGLTLTAGARLSKNKFYFGETRDGPVNGGVRNFVSASQSATAFTPKIGANYKLGENNMVYGSVSRGLPPGRCPRHPWTLRSVPRTWPRWA